jgi:hypothetical protein
MFVIPAPKGSSPHHPSFTSAAGTKEAHEIAVTIGKTLALVGWDLLTDSELFASVKAEWSEQMALTTSSA